MPLPSWMGIIKLAYFTDGKNSSSEVTVSVTGSPGYDLELGYHMRIPFLTVQRRTVLRNAAIPYAHNRTRNVVSEARDLPHTVLWGAYCFSCVFCCQLEWVDKWSHWRAMGEKMCNYLPYTGLSAHPLPQVQKHTPWIATSIYCTEHLSPGSTPKLSINLANWYTNYGLYVPLLHLEKN